MQERTWNHVDKSTWGEGVWQEEPDKIQWTDGVTGLPCLAVRHPSAGHWCGYVGVAEGHSLFGVEYSSCSLSESQPRGERPSDREPMFPGGELVMPDSMIERLASKRVCSEDYCDHTPEHLLDAHGGITFSGFCQTENKETGMCHFPDEGEPERVYWFGFDCAHAGDKSPGHARLGWGDDIRESYRSLRYVKGECSRLAYQLANDVIAPAQDLGTQT